MKKLIGLLVVSFAFTSLVAHASFIDDYAYDNYLDEASTFTDVSVSHPNLRAINMMYQMEIVEGYDDGTFGPDNSINRAELMKIVVAERFDGGSPDPETYHNCFNDINQEWFAPYICYAYEQGWVEGYDDGTFRPANNVNRVEALKILLNISFPDEEWPDPTEADLAVTMPADLDMEQWYAPFVRFGIVKELVDGQHVTQDSAGNVYYYPAGDMTRKEVVESIFRFGIYVVERDTYAQAMGELACFQAMNEEYANGLTEAEQNSIVYKIFDIYGFDETEADAVITKYYYDNIGDSRMESYTVSTCGEGVEYDNWLMDMVTSE